jgi:hypothetical protein
MPTKMGTDEKKATEKQVFITLSPVADATSQFSSPHVSKGNTSDVEVVVGPISPKVHTTMSPLELRQIAMLRERQRARNVKTDYSLLTAQSHEMEGNGARETRRRTVFGMGGKDDESNSPQIRRSHNFHDESVERPAAFENGFHGDSKVEKGNMDGADETGDEVKSLRLGSFVTEHEAEPRALLWKRNPARDRHAKSQFSPGGSEQPICPPFKEQRRRTFFGLTLPSPNNGRDAEITEVVKNSKITVREICSTETKKENSDHVSPTTDSDVEVLVAVLQNADGANISDTRKNSSNVLDMKLGHARNTGVPSFETRYQNQEPITDLKDLPQQQATLVREIRVPLVNAEFGTKPPKKNKHVRLEGLVPSRDIDKEEYNRRTLKQTDQGAENEESSDFGIRTGSKDATDEHLKSNTAISESKAPPYANEGASAVQTTSATSSSTSLVGSLVAPSHESNQQSSNYLDEQGDRVHSLASPTVKPIRMTSVGKETNFSTRARSWDGHPAHRHASDVGSQTSPVSPEVQSEPQLKEQRRRTFFVSTNSPQSGMLRAEINLPMKGDKGIPTEKNMHKSTMKGFMSFSKVSNNYKASSSRAAIAVSNRQIKLRDGNAKSESHVDTKAITDSGSSKVELKQRGTVDVKFPAHVHPPSGGSGIGNIPTNVKKSLRRHLVRKKEQKDSTVAVELLSPRVTSTRRSLKGQAGSASGLDKESISQLSGVDAEAEICVLPLHNESNNIAPGSSCGLFETIAIDDFQSDQNMGPSCPANTPTGSLKQTLDSPTPSNIRNKIAVLEAEAKAKEHVVP